MNNLQYDIKTLINLTEDLMRRNDILIRDTWDSYDGKNFDDYFVNGNSFHLKKHISIILKEDGYTEVKSERCYPVLNFKHSAYDCFQIMVPKRIYPLKHPIIHELVHFLQENNKEQDESYINYNGSNPKEYLSQRCELEAFFVQIKFICEQVEIKDLTSEQMNLLDDFRVLKFSQKNEIVEKIITIMKTRLI